jgi:hypothetical protein
MRLPSLRRRARFGQLVRVREVTEPDALRWRRARTYFVAKENPVAGWVERGKWFAAGAPGIGPYRQAGFRCTRRRCRSISTLRCATDRRVASPALLARCRARTRSSRILTLAEPAASGGKGQRLAGQRWTCGSPFPTSRVACASSPDRRRQSLAAAVGPSALGPVRRPRQRGSVLYPSTASTSPQPVPVLIEARGWSSYALIRVAKKTVRRCRRRWRLYRQR